MIFTLKLFKETEQIFFLFINFSLHLLTTKQLLKQNQQSPLFVYATVRTIQVLYENITPLLPS